MATEILRPNGNGNSIWDAFLYTLIDDVVEDPSSSGDGDYAMCDRSDDGFEETWNFESVSSLITITNCRVYLRHEGNGYNDTIDYRVNIGGSWQAAKTSANLTSSFVWTNGDFAGSWVPSDFDNLLLGVVTGSMGPGDEYRLGVAYVVLTGEIAGGSEVPQTSPSLLLFLDM